MTYSEKDVKGWVHDPNGISTGGWGVTLTVRDMAKFGQMYLNEGIHNGKQVLSKSWIKRIDRNEPKINMVTYGGYEKKMESFSYCAMGDGGGI